VPGPDRRGIARVFKLADPTEGVVDAYLTVFADVFELRHLR
jgi:hypothetical protein